MRKKILYIGDVGQTFSAKFVHALGICGLLRDAGYDVKILCDGHEAKEERRIFNDLEFSYTKQCISRTRLKSVENVIEWGYGFKLWNLFRKTAKDYKPDYVVLYGYVIEKKMLRYCKKHQIPMIVERVDWFQRDDYSTDIEKLLFYSRAQKAILKWDKAVDGVISISPFFQKYYKEMGVNTIQIPPLFTEKIVDCPLDRKNKGVLKLVYAGSLGGKKDSILPVIQVVHKINHNKKLVELSLVGLAEGEVAFASGVSDLQSAGIVCHGRVPHDRALEIVAEADFSFLLRENKRYAKAGFSTKFAESMLCGVPVICTKVGGADTVIESGKDGLLLADNTYETLEKTVEYLLEMKSDEILAMKCNAYRTAEKLFLSSNYLTDIKTFLDEI